MDPMNWCRLLVGRHRAHGDFGTSNPPTTRRPWREIPGRARSLLVGALPRVRTCAPSGRNTHPACPAELSPLDNLSTRPRVSNACPTPYERPQAGKAKIGPDQGLHLVDPVSLNANHAPGLQLGIPASTIAWRDGREALPTRELHRRATKRRHQDNPGFHEAALGGLDRGRERRAWSTEEILAAIRRFRRDHGRWPTQKDFRSAHGLPGYGTVWRRFDTVAAAVELAHFEGTRVR